VDRPFSQDPSAADPERVVVECCAAGTPAVVTFRDGGVGLRGVFSSFRNERVELELADVPPGDLDEGTLCFVSFLYRGRPVNFAAPLRSARSEAGRLCVRVGVPAHIVSEGLRSAFRVPSGPGDHGVDLVGDDGITWHATLVNLSLTGMLLRFPGEGPTLMPDQVVEISVKVGSEHVRLAGVVRRVGPDGVGVFFPDAVSSSPENPIRRAVAALERDWHARLRR
jgi:hypothetical protein